MTMKNTTQETVMICDDEQDILDLYRRALEHHYNVIAICSGKDCIERYVSEKNSGNKIDILLLDYRLGDMLGNEVACKIKRLDGTKVVLVSAYELEENMVERLIQERCIVATFRKPLSLNTLAEKVASL
jgi:response regulator RpfG family c-di-GMP phosphodiesterase